MKPLIIRRERIVSVPADVLWQFVEPAKLLSSWLPMAESCEVLGGRGLGRRQRMTSKWGRRTAQIDQEVIDYKPNALLRWRHVDEQINGKPAPKISKEVTFTIELEEIGPGTRIALESRNVPSNFFGAMLLRFVAARRIGRALDKALNTLESV